MKEKESTPQKLEVGQKLWFVSRYSWSRMTEVKGYSVTITKVGRKYAHLDNRNRIFLDNLVVDGGQYSSPGECHLSEQDYLATIERQREISEFRKLMTSMSFKNITLEQIRTANEVLGVQDEKAT